MSSLSDKEIEMARANERSVKTIDPSTGRYPGVAQWQMSQEQQKAAGLIATNNRSITNRQTKQGKIN